MSHLKGRTGFQPRSHPSERRADFDLHRHATAVEDRVAVLEALNIDSRLDALEARAVVTITTVAITPSTNWTLNANADEIYLVTIGAISFVLFQCQFVNGTGAAAAPGTTMGTIPASVRPLVDRDLVGWNSSPVAYCRIRVQTGGNINLQDQPGGNLANGSNTRVTGWWPVV